MNTAAVDHKAVPLTLPSGWGLSRNENGSITVWDADGGAVVVSAVAYEDRRMPEEMLYALADAMLEARANSRTLGPEPEKA